jgi:outer membrane protein assembly factor BamB
MKDDEPPMIVLALSAFLMLDAEVLRRIPAAEARQGVAVQGDALFAINNNQIGKYDRLTGAKIAAWTGDRARFPHINSCAAIGLDLVCASSNFPSTPMTSAVEIFDPIALRHLRTVALEGQAGSLTWLDRHGGFWWAAFANYDGFGGVAGRDHRDTILVRYDDAWKPLSTYSFPPDVLARFKPSSSSGGVFGDDGLLYVTGHDHAEVYVLRVPLSGSVLEHVATISAPIEGQAIAWGGGRILYGINRAHLAIIEMRLPPVKP